MALPADGDQAVKPHPQGTKSKATPGPSEGAQVVWTRLRAQAWEGGGKGKKGERRRGQEGEGEERAFVLASHPPPQSPRATISYANSDPSPSLSHPPLLGPAPSLWVYTHTHTPS